MPRISAFYGIVITMRWVDHAPPHFHARYAGAEASVAIASGRILVGDLPSRAYRLVRRWTQLHRAELEVNWTRTRAELDPVPIEPLP